MVPAPGGDYLVEHGDGVRTWNNGDVYDGEFRHGMAAGQGKITYANGDTYEGAFDNDSYNGYGTFFDSKEGIKKSGVWVDNEMNGEGEEKNKDGSTY